MPAVKAKRSSVNRAVPVPCQIIDRAWKRFAAALVAAATVMPAISGTAAAHAPASVDSGAAGSLTGGDWVLGSGGSWSFGTGWSYATTEEAGEAPDSISLMAWMIEDVRRHWGLSQEGSLDPVAIVEHWVSGASTVDYSLTTGADDWDACHLLLEGFEPSGRGTKEDVLAGFLTQPSVCGRLWAAATAWSQSAAGEYPLDDHTRLAEAMWRGSGLASGDGDGFAALYYEPDNAPYCGYLPTDAADDNVLVPVSCPRPPSVQLCLEGSPPAAVEGDAESAVIVNGLYEVPPSSGSFDVPQCSAIERAVDGKPNASQYQWTARWWDPDGNPVGSPGGGSSVEDAGNCQRPTGADGWVLGLCANEKKGGAVVKRNVLQADWSWTPPPPVRPQSKTLLAAISPPEERAGLSRGEPRLNCDVPESRMTLAESERREAQWVQLYTFRVDPCMVDATLALFELAESHGIQLIVGPNGGGRTWGYQMYLRRKNCPAGWTDEQFANGPAPQCSPITALPGKSRHNSGMAIDFNCNSFDHPCYRWLNEHATRLGFHDLPRSANEPWHWAAAPHH